MATSNTEDLWNPYKELKSVVWKQLNDIIEDSSVTEFEDTLRKNKQSFFSLLQNPPKNAKSREDLKKGMVDGINVRGIGHQVLSKELYQEAVILSDMFDLNEFVALDLLCTAQIQMPYYPDLPRGLVAILLYYDGRKALVTTLLYLVQARNGVQWTVNARPEIAEFVTQYTNELMEGGLFNRIFELLRSLDLSKEMDKLQQNLALGGAKHRRQVTDLFNSVRNILAEIVFSWSAQTGLTKEPTLGLISYLREVKIEEEASGKIDDVNLYLQMALLSALDLSILHTREDGEEVVQSLPVLSDPSYIQAVVNEFSPTKNKWQSEGLQALSTFGLSVCLASMRIIPQNLQFQDVLNKDEPLADASIEMNVFSFIHNILLENNTVFKEPFLYKRIHTLITDFIVYMYPKVKDLRMTADDTSRTMQAYIKEGLGIPSTLTRSFEYLLLTIHKLYSNDQLNTDYALCFWSPLEINSNQSFSYRAPPRAVSLFRFVKLAGDMLPSVLFVPYIKMLVGLSSSQQTARHCFNMLKQVGFLSSNISWDHFFISFAQYYQNLRQETPLQADTIYRNRGVYHKGVSPQELEGLHSVLLLIKTVAENDEFSRLALCEHPGWSPLTILLGLVSCSVPIPLKADLLLTLSALSKCSENAVQMWENLEASQILVTIPTTSSYAPRGIQTELDEIESRMEEYPLTRALLKLLDTLTNFGIPRTLGAGPRKPGFDPYLSFIINSVFLKHNSRSYRNPVEKWEVALLCLKLFEKFLSQYDPKTTDFPSNTSEFNPPPGYHIMLQINNRTEVLHVILDIIDDGNRFFDSYVTFQGQETVKECTLCSLNILHRALVLQPRFFSILATTNAPLILSGLSKLLLTINRRSGKPDHCINIAKYVTYQLILPKHSQVSVKILCNITSSPALHSQFMSVLLSNEEALKVINVGFCECLDSSFDDSSVVDTKKEILRLLKQCLVYNSPNLTHILMGFDLKKGITKTHFQFPGVLGFPRTCLHSLISIIDSSLSKYGEKPSTSLLESSFHLLYLLAHNNKTSEPVLRFIRSNKTFYIDHMKYCCKNIKKGMHEYNQTSWLMRTLAIELKVASQSKQISYLQQLTSCLVNAPIDETNSEVFCIVRKNLMDSKIITPDDIKLENFLTKMLEYMEFKSPPVERPNWEFFDNSALTSILKQCQKKIPPKLIDLKKLHQILYDELRTLHGTAVMGQIQAITQEIPKVLKYALELNKYTEQCHAIIQFSDAWRQVAEVIVIYMPLEIINSMEQQVVSIGFACNILKKAVSSQLLPEVARFLSGASLITVGCLKRGHFREQRIKKVMEQDENRVNVKKYYFSCLKEILADLVEWILTSDVTDGELRINLYATLVQFLQFTSTEPEHEDLTVESSFYISRLDSSRFNIDHSDRNVKLSSDITSAFSEKLIEVICHDCIGGQEICKILAMSSFSHLLQLSGNVQWIMYLSSRGYLKHVIQSIMESDKDLKNMMEPQSESIKPLYLYLAKMLLLIRLAGTRLGAELILEQKLLGVFSNMSVFSYHPEITKIWEGEDVLEDFLPTVEQQYLQIWMPTLELCNTLLTTLGTENQSAVAQIMYFIFSHLDVIELVLRSGHPELSPQSMRELCLVTSVLARTANNNLINIMENPNLSQNNRAQLYRLQKLMLSLMPKFIITENLVKKLLSHSARQTNLFQTSERLIYAMQIMANLVCYARNVVANHGIEHSGVGVIFYPCLTDPLLNSFTTKSLGNVNDQEPSLGVVVQQLMSTVNYQHQEKVTYDILVRKLKDVQNMNSGELNDLIGDTPELTDLTFKKEKAYEVISDRLEKKRKEMEYCAFIIENCLYLIWVHLDYYMLKAIPKARNFGYLQTNPNISGDTTLLNAMEATWKVSTEVISNLKQGLVSLFNDSFSKQLLETAQGRSESDRGFVEALLRKIKRLVQFVPVK